MNVQHIIPSYSFSTMIAEDVGVPALRNPIPKSAKTDGRFRNLLREKLLRFLA